MPRTLEIIGIPMDLGQSRRGVDMGPSAVRYAGLDARLSGHGCNLIDRGNIEVPIRDTLTVEGGLAYTTPVVAACQLVYEAGRTAQANNHVPIFLGGDHSVAMGTVGGVTHDSSCGVLWIDAHADFNTHATSPSGNLHGMPLAALMGLGDSRLVNIGRPGAKLNATDVILIGIRDLDIEERTQLKQSGVGVYTMREVDERGIATVAREAIRRLAHHNRLHISLDMDSLDPREAPGVGTPVPGGLSYREAHLLMEILADTRKVGSLDVVEVNPILDHRNTTAKIAVELVASLLGESIL